MAGDWIPMRMDLLDDPSVISISSTLGLEEYAVVGRLLKLWSWANRHLKDGHAFVPDKWIDNYLNTPGFAAALLAAGWLKKRPDGYEFTSFDRWNSQGAKIRLGETLRKKAFRAKQAKSTPTKTVPKLSGTLSGTGSPGSPGPEKRREEYQEGASAPSVAAKGSPRPRNLLFDAVAEVSGLDPSTAGEAIGVAAAKMAKATPPYTPDEVREFGRQFWELCPYAAERGRSRPTPHEIAKNIGLIRSGPGNPNEVDHGRSGSSVRRGGRVQCEESRYGGKQPILAGDGAPAQEDAAPHVPAREVS